MLKFIKTKLEELSINKSAVAIILFANVLFITSMSITYFTGYGVVCLKCWKP